MVTRTNLPYWLFHYSKTSISRTTYPAKSQYRPIEEKPLGDVVSDASEQAIAELKEDIESLRRQMKRLVRSDRAQTKKLKWQHKLSMMSLGLIAIGSLTMFRGLTVEDRATLERIAIGILAAGVSGAVGVNLPSFQPPESEEDEDEI